MAKVAKKEALVREGQVVGVRFKFNGGGTYELTFDQLDSKLILAATAHGLLQKLGDAYASAKGDPKIAEGLFLPVFESLIAGEWNRKGERGMTGLAVLVEAIVRITGKDEGVVRAKIDGMTKEEIAALKKRPEVDKVIKEIEYERAQAAAEEADEGSDLEEMF